MLATVKNDASPEETGAALQAEIERREQSESRGEKNEAIFRMFVESVQDYAIFMLDPQGRVATWNTGAQRIKGYQASEIIGSHFSRFYPVEDVRGGKCEMELDVASREGRFEDEGWRVRKDGTVFWANVVISAVRDEAGQLVGFSKITRDLTDRRKAEEERAARLAAEHANRAKDEFLAMLGHELRNPLAPIVTALDLIRMRQGAQVSKEHQVIERQVHHMMHLVDDLLDVSRITTGKVELRVQRNDVRDTITKAVETVSPLLEQRRHTVHVDVPDHALLVDADEARLTQVLTNLVTNAAKYTDPGGEIRIAACDVGGDIVIEVRDNGTGIPPDLLPRVFDLFVQGYQTSERAGGGLGLGLTLVRSLVEAHRGTVQASSEGDGRGSTFTVRLPAAVGPAPTDAPELPAAIAASPDKHRILIVDDNEDARLLLAEMLDALGHEVRTAGDGVEALKMIGEFAPQVAILDIGLPVMDGFELAGRIRAELATPPMLIALTGYGQQHDRERSAQAGFDAHLVKPVDLMKLIGTISPR
jgi:PAS domain S-box-containing protein